MEPVPKQKSWWSRALGLWWPPAYFLSLVVLDWNNAEWTWLGVMFLMGLAAIVEAVWTASSDRRKAARIASISLVAGAVILFAAGGWRHVVKPRDAEGFKRPAFIAAPITATPLNGVRGRTLTVTVDGPDPIFSDQSRPDFGPGIITVSSQMKSPTTLVAVVEIAAQAPPGHRRISISTPGRQTVIDNSNSGVFSVLPGPFPLQ